MVSLAAVETMAASLWPGCSVAAVALPDARKGERILLATTATEATRQTLSIHMRALGATELMVPSQVEIVPTIPLLGSGKTDYPAVTKLFKVEDLEAVATR